MRYHLRYARTALYLVMARRIRFRIFLRIVRERPIAVCGRHAAYILCPDMAKSYFFGA